MVKPRTSSIKRKIDTNELKEPVKKIVKDEKRTNTALKDMKKVDLLKRCEELLEENNLLKIKRSEMEAELTLFKEQINELKGNQKDYYGCFRCDYVAHCVHDFTDHTHEHEDLNVSGSSAIGYPCYYCEEVFDSKTLVMNHTRRAHNEKLQHCHNFLDDSCTYGEKCWYIHDDEYRNSCPNIKCNFCDEIFKTKSKLMKHMKAKHIESVKMCKNEDNNCRFGPQKCWYLHTENIEEAFKKKKNGT